jgi:hypothetical protein
MEVPMATPTIARNGQESTTRIDRGRQLYREHAADIVYQDSVWYVPSQQDTTSVYEVVIGRRGESCECQDFEYRGGPCLHIYAATIAYAKTRQCAGCSKRFPKRQCIEVHEEHGSLTWFVGDSLCRGCALAHGVL